MLITVINPQPSVLNRYRQLHLRVKIRIYLAAI